jgi:hypothetical protein
MNIQKQQLSIKNAIPFILCTGITLPSCAYQQMYRTVPTRYALQSHILSCYPFSQFSKLSMWFTTAVELKKH